jgi:hypothetical protein
VDEFLQDQGPLVTLEIAGTALVELMKADAASLAPAALTISYCASLRALLGATRGGSSGCFG